MNLRADVSAAVLILFIWISCSCCTAHPSSQISISTKPLHGLHIPTRQMITTLTIVFGVFGLLLLLALALLFLHFFVTDLSDYILCCCRITEETNQSSNSAGQKIYRWLCYATRRCNRNTTSASRNCRSIVYRPYSAQRNSSSNLPTCLNFRRYHRTLINGYDSGNIRSMSNGVFDSAQHIRNSFDQHSDLRINRRYSALPTVSVIPISNRNVADYWAFSQVLTQPPSYEDATRSSPSNNHLTPSYLQFGQLEVGNSVSNMYPPPPSYDQILMQAMPTNQAQRDVPAMTPNFNMNATSLAQRRAISSTTQSERVEPAPRDVSASENSMEMRCINSRSDSFTNCLVQKDTYSRNSSIHPANSIGSAALNMIVDDQPNQSVYDVTHVYSWHI